MPPDMPKYKGVADRWIGLLREKTIALLGELDKLAADMRKEKYWAEAWSYSTEAMNMCATMFNANGIMPYQMWYRKSPPMYLLNPFDTVGYLRRIKRGHKLAPHGKARLIMGVLRKTTQKAPSGS